MRFYILIWIILALSMPCAAFCGDNSTAILDTNNTIDNSTQELDNSSKDEEREKIFKYTVSMSDENLCAKIEHSGCEPIEDSAIMFSFSEFIVGIIMGGIIVGVFWFFRIKNREERWEEEGSSTIISTKYDSTTHTLIPQKPIVQEEVSSPQAEAKEVEPPPLTPVEALIEDYNLGDKNTFFHKYHPEFFVVENAVERRHFPNRSAKFRNDNNGYFMAVKMAESYLVIPKFSFIYNDTYHGVHAFGEVFGVLECREVYDRIELVKPAVFSKNGDIWSFVEQGKLRLSRR